MNLGVKKSDGKKLLILLFYTIVIIFFASPLFWLISLSLQTLEEILAYPPTIIPKSFALENYYTVLARTSMVKFIFNSAKLTFFSVLLALIITVPAAYGFSRFKFRGKYHFLFTLTTFQMISHLVIAIPLYRYFQKLGLLNSHLGAIFVYAAIQVPFTVWFLKGFFDTIPRELEEAAYIDGCSQFQSMMRVVLPLMLPGVAAVMIYNVINSWSQFIIPFMFLSKTELMPISVGILQFQDTQAAGEVTTHLLASASVLATLPALIIFVLLQRYIVKIMIAGALKG